jgi:plasmid stabilization system protein ParE
MKRFKLTPSARQDLNDIWNYIAVDNMEAANGFWMLWNRRS